MRTSRRYGAAVTEWCVIAALVVIAILASVSFLGDATQQRIDNDINGPDGVLGRQAEASK
jgi:hypothetical protein